MFICILFSLTRPSDRLKKNLDRMRLVSLYVCCCFFGLFVISLFKMKLKMIFGCLSRASQSGHSIHSLIRVQSQPNWCFCWCCMLYHISIAHYKNLYKRIVNLLCFSCVRRILFGFVSWSFLSLFLIIEKVNCFRCHKSQQIQIQWKLIKNHFNSPPSSDTHEQRENPFLITFVWSNKFVD